MAVAKIGSMIAKKIIKSKKGKDLIDRAKSIASNSDKAKDFMNFIKTGKYTDKFGTKINVDKVVKKLRKNKAGGGMSQKGLGRAFRKGGRS